MERDSVSNPDNDNDNGKESSSNKCVSCLGTFRNIIKSILVRLMLSTTIAMITWRSASVNNSQFPTSLSDLTNGLAPGRLFTHLTIDQNITSDINTNDSGLRIEPWFVYWLPILAIFIFIPELIVAWYYNDGNEYKWWSPAIAIYISSCLVSIWVIEMDLYIIKWYKMAVYPNSTSFDPDEDGNFFAPEPMGKVANYEPNLKLGPIEWARILEQLFAITIVFAKWMSPKGMMTRDQLSQLLLANISMATDILDLVDVLSFVPLGNDLSFVYATLTLYSVAHIQFTLNITATAPRPRKKYSKSGQITASSSLGRFGIVFYTPLWSILLGVFLQDAPFFFYRLYLISAMSIITLGNVFFTVKNGFMLMIGIYRIISILVEECRAYNRHNGRADRSEVFQKKKNSSDNSRATAVVTLTRRNIAKGEAVFAVTEDANVLNFFGLTSKDAVNMKKNQWHELGMAHSTFRNDQDLHLIFEVEFIMDGDSCGKDIEKASEPLKFHNVKVVNVVRRPLQELNSIYSNGSALRHRLNKVAPSPIHSLVSASAAGNYYLRNPELNRRTSMYNGGNFNFAMVPEHSIIEPDNECEPVGDEWKENLKVVKVESKPKPKPVVTNPVSASMDITLTRSDARRKAKNKKSHHGWSMKLSKAN